VLRSPTSFKVICNSQFVETELNEVMLIPCSFRSPAGASVTSNANDPASDPTSLLAEGSDISQEALENAGLSSMVNEPVKEPENSDDDPWALTDVDDIGEVSSALSSDLKMDEDLENVATESSDEVEALIGEGEALTRDGKNREALTLFNKAIALDPGAEMAWFNRGVILEAQGDTRGSRQSFGITLDLNPEHGPAAANLAIILDRMGDSQGAKRWAKVALDSFPGHHLLLDLLRRGDAAGTGVVAGANTVDISIMGQAQASEAAPERGELVWSEDDVKDAMDAHGIRDREAVLEEARLHDDDGNLYLDKEELHSAAGLVAATKAAEAEAESRAAVREEEDPDGHSPVPSGPDLETLCNQAKGLLRSGDAKGALSMLMEHLHGSAAQHPDSWRISAGAMARLDLNDNAIDAFNHALSLDDGDASAWYNLGAIHRRKNENERAAECFKNALHRKHDYVRAAHSLATISIEIGDVEEALDAWRKLLELEPEHDSKIEFATLLVELAEGEAAVLEHVKGVPPTIPEGPVLANEALPMLTENSTLRARALSIAGMHTDAVLCWKELLKVDKEEASYWLGLSKALVAAGDEATAARCRSKYDELSGVVFIDAANQSLAVDSPPPAVVATVEPVATAPAPAPVVSDSILLEPIAEQENSAPETVQSPQIDLAKVALDATQKVTAEANNTVVSKSTSVANQDVEWYNKGLGLLADKKYKQALSCFDKALPMFTHDDSMIIRILNARGNCFYYLEDYPKCIDNHHKAMLIDPNSVTGATLYNMGTAYGEMERYDDAVKCFEQSIPRGLTKEQQKLAKEQVRRCNLLSKEKTKKGR